MQDRNDDLAVKCGTAIVTFSSNEVNMSMGFDAVPTHYAASVMTALATISRRSTPVVVKSPSVVDNTTIHNSSDGGDDMDKRLAVLEAEVAHIKSSMAEIKEDTRNISSDSTDAKRDTAVLLQKSLDFDASLSKKPSVDYFDAKFSALETKIADVKVWILGVLLASFAMPTIFFLLNLYLKKGQ